MAQRKSLSNSISELVKSNEAVALPDGVVFSTDEELTIWKQLTSARSSGNWRDFDLLFIAKLVIHEIELRQINTLIKEQGLMVANQRGTQIENPLLRSRATITGTMLAITGKLSLGVMSKDAIAKNNSGKKSDSEKLNKLKKESPASLLAH